MAFDRIRKVDLVGIGVIGLADTPALSTAEMQKKFEETAREVLMPAHNALVDKLNAEGAAHIGAVTPDGLTTTVQGALDALDAAIDDKVQELGAGDMAKAVYDPKGAGVDVTVQVYTHTKSDNVHEFVGTGANGRVRMTADVAEGDTVTVNGKAVPAWAGAEDFAAALAGQPLTGRWLSFVFDGAQINFKGGGGAVTVEGLAAENIVAGQTVTVRQGTKVVAQVEGGCPPGGLFVWTDTAHPDLQVTAADTPCFTVEGAAVTVRKPCTLRLTAAMMTHTSVNSTTTHTARFVKNGEAVCIAVATGTGAVPARGVQTAAVAVQAGDVVRFEATAGYPNNQMAFGCLTVE